MLTEFLRSFTLPGLEKKYIVADDSLTEEGAAADAKKVGEELAKKVDKETGKALSTNDYTNAEKTKLAGVDSGAQVNTIEGVKVDGTEVTPDAQKKVNLNVYNKAAIDAIVQAIYAEVAKKLNIDGYSELATVGNALGLVTDSVVEDKEPYNFRSLAHLPVGKFCYDTIVGGSIVWNQLAETPNNGGSVNGLTWTFSKAEGTVTINGTATARTAINLNQKTLSGTGHVAFLCGCPSGGSTSTYSLQDGWGVSNGNRFADTGTGLVGKKGETVARMIPQIVIQSGVVCDNLVFRPVFTDLTAALPSAIANYIYSLEQTTAGAGVAWLRKYFSEVYYGFTEPHFEHVQVSAKNTVGFNQFDDEVEAGYINVDTGQNDPSSVRYRGKNHIRVLPNTVYYFKNSAHAVSSGVNYRLYFYDENKAFINSPQGTSISTTFTTPSNCHYVRFFVNEALSNYNNDICINFSGDRNGEYEPYRKRTYPIEPKVLRGIPKLDSANRLYFDGDIYRHDGSGEYRYSEKVLAASDIRSNLTTYENVVYARIAKPNTVDIASVANIVGYPCSDYNGNWNIAANIGLCFTKADIQNWWVGFAPGTTIEQATNALVGKTMVYELKTPEPFTAEPYQSPMVVDPLGTEEFVDYAVEQGDRDVKIPCGHTSEYPEDLVDKLEVLPHATGTNGDYLITELNGKLYLKPYTQTVGLTSVSETEAEL